MTTPNPRYIKPANITRTINGMTPRVLSVAKFNSEVRKGNIPSPKYSPTEEQDDLFYTPQELADRKSQKELVDLENKKLDYSNVNLPIEGIVAYREMIKSDFNTIETICDSPQAIEELYSRGTHYAVNGADLEKVVTISKNKVAPDISYRHRNLIAVKEVLKQILAEGSITHESLDDIAENYIFHKKNSVNALKTAAPDYVRPFIVKKDE